MKAERVLLLVNIGNTNTTMAVARRGRIRRVVRFPTHPLPGPDTLAARVRRFSRAAGRPPDRAVLCSVVPRTDRTWRWALEEITGRPPLRLTSRCRLGVKLDGYPRPATIGADRLAAAAAAWARYRSAVIVVDLGTALTVNAITRDGRFLGGAIAPGPDVMAEYLGRRAAQLPRIRASGPIPRIGRSTRAAMRVGILAGYRGVVRDLVAHVARALGRGPIRICVTGGGACGRLTWLGRPVSLDPWLALRGLLVLDSLNPDEEK